MPGSPLAACPPSSETYRFCCIWPRLNRLPSPWRATKFHPLTWRNWRARANKTAGAVDFTDMLSTEQHRFKIHAIDQAAKTAPQPAVPRVATKAVPDVPQAPNKRPRAPRKQRMAKLAAEKKAAGAAAVAAAAASSTSAPTRTPPRGRSHRRSRSRPHRRTDTRRSPPRNPPCAAESYSAPPLTPPFPLRRFLNLNRHLPMRTERPPTNRGEL